MTEKEYAIIIYVKGKDENDVLDFLSELENKYPKRLAGHNAYSIVEGENL